MTKVISRLVTTTLFLCTSYGQEVVVDWAAKKVSSQPSTVENQTTATVRLNNVNDFMFTYSVSYQLKPLAISDFDTIAKAFSLAGAVPKAAGEAAKCDISTVLHSQQALADAESAFVRLPATKSGCSESQPCNVTLEQAKASWDQTITPKLTTAQDDLDAFTKSCPSDPFKTALRLAADAINQALTKYNGSHSIEKAGAIVLSPDKVTSLEVDQLWMGTPTTDGTYSVDLTSSNNRLTLSAGGLFSEIQNRTYAAVTAPSSTGNGTLNVLSVGGLGKFNSAAVALLNYEIPHLDWERLGIGFALSTGPVFRLGSKSDTSTFGYFAGISFHLFHRFYVTPGFHFGEFADFPVGVSYPNQVIPSGIGTPTPVKRWTWRFGFGVSYKAKDFSQFGLSGSVKPTGNTTKGN